jgi:uncharacterized protein (DUF488 family)
LPAGYAADVASAPVIWTVGHSNHSLERLAELLRMHSIDCVVDVRSYPYSRVASQFNRERLADELPRRGVRYAFLGEQLGGRPSRAGDYDDDGHARYDRMARRPAFIEATERLLHACAVRRIALMCSEAQPGECHRRLLVGKVLAERGVQLRHILPDGSVQQEERVFLDSPHGHGQESLFDEGAAWRSTRSVSHRRRLSASSSV